MYYIKALEVNLELHTEARGDRVMPWDNYSESASSACSTPERSARDLCTCFLTQMGSVCALGHLTDQNVKYEN